MPAHQLIHLQQIVCSGTRGRGPADRIGSDRSGNMGYMYIYGSIGGSGAGPLD